MVNMKGPDYTAHAYGPASAEQRETLAELDRQMTKILELLDKKAGPGRSVVAITADHGMPGEPAPGHRHHPDDIAAIKQRFDPKEKRSSSTTRMPPTTRSTSTPRGCARSASR